MNRRRVTAAFAVLLAHALVFHWLAVLPALRDRFLESPDSRPITLYLEQRSGAETEPTSVVTPEPSPPPASTSASAARIPPAQAVGAITAAPGRVD